MQGKQHSGDSSQPKKKRWTPTSGNITRIAVKEPAELMAFLLDKMGGMKRNSVKTMLSHRQILVNGAVTTFFATELKAGDVVEISSARGNIELSHPKLKMLYEDDAIIVDEKKTGNEMTALMEVSLEHPKFFDSFADAIQKLEYIVSCYYQTGDFDLIIRISCHSSDELEEIHRQVMSLPGVDATRTHVVLKNVKNIYSAIRRPDK